MFKRTLNLLAKAALAAGVLLGALAVVEVLRAYLFLRELSPWAGRSFLALVALLVLLLAGYVAATLAAYPRVLRPPPRPAGPDAPGRGLARYARYLERYLGRLAANASLSGPERDTARDAAQALAAARHAPALPDAVERVERDLLPPLLDTLAGAARREVRRSTRDVLLGVTLSPYHSMDLAIVVYRNVSMVMRIVRIYASRPLAREQVMILRDVLRVVATVNFLHLGKKLFENLFSNVPFIGRGIDDIGQGLGAGLLTSAAGHAAIQRCAAFDGWDRDAAARSLAGMTRQFFADIRDLFFKDVMPEIRGKLRAELPPETVRDPDFWDRLNDGVGTAFDATVDALDDFVLRPAVRAGSTVVRATSRGTRSIGNGLARLARALWSRSIRTPGASTETRP